VDLDILRVPLTPFNIVYSSYKSLFLQKTQLLSSTIWGFYSEQLDNHILKEKVKK
jgi:hypothetical protein